MSAADIKRLQTRVGVAQDGVFGPATLAAVNAALDSLNSPCALTAPSGGQGGPISLITEDLLRVAVPNHPNPGEWVEPIRKACQRFEINTVRRVCAFIAQMAHESGLQSRDENLNYSAARLCEVWPSRFPSIARAEPYAHNPEALANRVYANRMGNGDEASGDGWRYRGAGPLQVTGKSNWSAFADAMNMSLEAALAYGRTIEGGVMAAAWFWETNDINRLADTPGVNDETRRINGGEVGLADRKAKFDALVNAMLRAGA